MRGAMTSLAPVADTEPHNPTFDRRAQAEHYVSLSPMAATMLRAFDQMIEAASDGECGLADIADVDRLESEVREMAVSIFADMYTPDELRAAIAFATSPAGQSILGKQRAIEDAAKAAMPAIMERCAKP